MNPPQTPPPVTFRTLPTASGHRLGVATLDAPATLNALSLDMVRRLDPQLSAWAEDPSVVAVVLDAAGDRAFCAGGDLLRLHAAIRTHGAGRNPDAEAFFGEQYVLDHRIHRYPKPLVAWAHGIVMGGGVGLMVGASHRVVTERTRLAMPEVAIGLFPDVGGSAFLGHIARGAGLFLALTGASLDAAGAVHAGLADAFVPHDRKAGVVAALAAAPWCGAAEADRALTTRVLAAHAAPLPDGADAPPLARHADLVAEVVAGDDLDAIARRLAALVSHDDPWLRAAAQAFVAGSPTSAALAFTLQRRAAGRSLADVLRLEYHAALGCCAHADFAEGVRALLVDKDRSPRWSPSRLEEVTTAHVADHLRPRAPWPAPLAAL